MKKKSLLFSILILFSALVFGQTKREKKELKQREQEKQFEATKQLLDSATYEFNADWANSFQGRRISLVTNPNHLKMNKNEAKIYLPYYGIAHTSNAAFANDGGVVFEGSVEDYQFKVNEKKKEITITFRCRATRETLDFSLTVYASGNSRLTVNSSIRTGVKYEGRTSSLATVE